MQLLTFIVNNAFTLLVIIVIFELSILYLLKGRTVRDYAPGIDYGNAHTDYDHSHKGWASTLKEKAHNLHVLMFGWEYPPHNSGGLGVACEGLVTELRKKNAKVTFILPSHIPGYEDEDLDFADGVISEVHPSSMGDVVRELLSPYTSPERHQELLVYYKKMTGKDFCQKSLLERVDAYRIDAYKLAKKYAHAHVIHAHDWLSFGAGIAAKEATGKPLIVHVHATEFDRGGGQGVNEEVYKREREGMEKADRVIAVSEFTKSILMREYGIEGTKITVVHNGVKKTETSFISLEQKIDSFKKRGYPVVLFLGRLTIQKGVDYFIYAAQKVLEHAPNTRFVIAGSGDMEQKVIDMVSALGLSNRVIMAGFVKAKDTQKLYEAANVYVMPSISEPFGITALESLQAGTPVILSKQSGAAEVVTHGLKCDFWDVEDLANKILSVIHYSPLSSTLSHEGKRQVEHITWEKAADKCVTLYRSLVNTNNNFICHQ
jgi:glycosyltransferase involved in cell wall biosynthesis